MANHPIKLGKHWESFIRKEVSSGRYESASEVIRDALRTLEERKDTQEHSKENSEDYFSIDHIIYE